MLCRQVCCHLSSQLLTPAAFCPACRPLPALPPPALPALPPPAWQVQKIRLLLRQRGLGAIRVGTVDDYQGQEERIIFISTVLSRPESLPPARPPAASVASAGAGGGAGSGEEGAGSLGAAAAAAAAATAAAAASAAAASEAAAGDVHLGFWRNPKRFNVAVTRAKALLVVAGHPAVLLEDASWRELLRQASGVCSGAAGAAAAPAQHICVPAPCACAAADPAAPAAAAPAALLLLILQALLFPGGLPRRRLRRRPRALQD